MPVRPAPRLPGTGWEPLGAVRRARYGLGMNERSRDGHLIVRMFPDHAGTVLWSGGAVDLDEARLSPRLQDDLRAWDAFHRSRLDPDARSHAPEDEHEFAVTGVALAGRVADELGRGVEVHLIVEGRRVFGSAEPPTNPRAAKALHVRAERQAEEARAVTERLGGGGWYAYSPASGNRFTPGSMRRASRTSDAPAPAAGAPDGPAAGGAPDSVRPERS